jgi:phytoene synthase
LADDEVDLKEDKSASVYDLVERLDKVYSGSPRDLPMDRAFARMVEETEMPRALPEALIEGLGLGCNGAEVSNF